MAKLKCPQCGTRYTGNFCPTCSAPAPEQPPAKKKKWLIPVVILAVIVLAAACSGGSGSETRQTTGAQSGAVSGEAGTAGGESGSAAAKATLDETELYNQGGICVTATGLSDGTFGPDVDITVTNGSDRNIVVVTQDLSVNGYMLSAGSGLYSDVAAGKNALDELSLSRSDLREAGIETIAVLEFSLRIYDSDSYDTIDETGLLQLTTSAAEGFTQPVDDSGEVVYDADGLRVICKGLKDDSIWDGCVVFLFENESGDTLTLSGENVSVNGFMVDPGLWTRLRTGTRAVDAMYLLDLDELGLESIDEVENIEFSLNIITDDFDIRSTDPIVLQFQ